MLPTLQIGPLAFQTPGLILLLGLWLGLNLSEKIAKSRGADSEALGNLVFYSLIAALLGARFFYVLRFPSAFVTDPASLISLNPGLLDRWGALASGLVTAIVYGQRRNLPLWPSLDFLTPLFALISIAGALSHLASGQAYGLPTDLPWALNLWGAGRHPTQIYEALAASAILAWLWIMRGRLLSRQGVFFLSFLTITAAMATFLWSFRAQAELVLGLRANQALAWLTLAAALWLLNSRQQSQSPNKVQ